MTTIRSFIALGAAATVSMPSLAQKAAPLKKSLPNIVIILMDDMGYGDIRTHRANQYETPNIDRLAAQGMQFTWFYCPQAVSSASRAGLLTGCYPNRIGISGALMPWSEVGINPDETTIAEMLKTKGYYCGIIGKWHLGHHQKFLPLQNGFDEYFGLPYSNDMWPVDFDGIPIRFKDSTDYRMKYPPLPLIEGNEKAGEILTFQDQDKLTTLYTERAVKFIEKNKNRPFFLYIAHSMVHVPLGVSDKFRGKSPQGMFGDVMMEVDWSVGEVMKVLERNGLEKNTLVIFTSDNGPWLNFWQPCRQHGGLREGKGTSWEGGQRGPCIMRWPGMIPAELCATTGFFPRYSSDTCRNYRWHRFQTKKLMAMKILPLLLVIRKLSRAMRFLYYYQQSALEAVQIRLLELNQCRTRCAQPIGSFKPGSDACRVPPVRRKLKQSNSTTFVATRGEQYDVFAMVPLKR
jgi:arylsulfatase